MSYEVRQGDCLEIMRTLEPGGVRCCVTSPPYWGLRDYGHAGQLGLERTPEEYVARMVEVFREVRRVLADDGTLWLNLGSTFAGGGPGGPPSESSTLSHGGGPKIRRIGVIPAGFAAGFKPKDLVPIPWMVAMALQADGWYLRSDIIWAKPNPMPESVTDRPTKAHEYLFLLAKSQRYYYDAAAIAEPATFAGKVVTLGEKSLSRGQATGAGVAASGNGLASEVTVADTRNRRTVWTVAPQPFRGAHFAVMPEKLVEPCILAGSQIGDAVLDPFAGSGTVGVVAKRHGRDFFGIELNAEYINLAKERIGKVEGVANG
jgi:DNA modification methylase